MSKNWGRGEMRPKLKIKCNGCKYWYTGNAYGNGVGYNPCPCCHKLDETGEKCNPLTFECFVKRRK